MSMILDEEATVVRLPMSVKRRKMSTAKEGSVGLKHAAGVLSNHTLIATPVITCVVMSGVWPFLARLAALPSCSS